MPSVYKQKKTTSKVILFCLIVMCKSENLNTYSAKNIGRVCHCRALMHSAYCCSASKYSFKESPQERLVQKKVVATTFFWKNHKQVCPRAHGKHLTAPAYMLSKFNLVLKFLNVSDLSTLLTVADQVLGQTDIAPSLGPSHRYHPL